MRKTKSKSKSKSWLGLAIVNLCLVLLCGTAFGASAFILRADAADYEKQELAAEEWFVVEPDGSELTVHLKNRLDGYAWKYGLSNDTVREVYRFELTEEEIEHEVEDEWNVHFIPNDGYEGEVTITFVYIPDSESNSIDTRPLRLNVKDGKITVISN